MTVTKDKALRFNEWLRIVYLGTVDKPATTLMVANLKRNYPAQYIQASATYSFLEGEDNDCH